MNPAPSTAAAQCLAARDGLAVWTAEADDELLCVAIHDETADVRSFTFVPRSPTRFHYLPGQFLTFDIPTERGIVQRCYTIASSPTRPDRLTITVKRQPGGIVSPWLHDHLHPGMSLRALGPMGDFTFAAAPAERYLFISGGSGITPLMSMTRAHHDLAPATDIVFLHFARTSEDIIFRDELAFMARTMPNLRVIPVCEADAPGARWGGPRGRVDAAMLQLLVPDLVTRTIFDCGPAPFMAAIRAALPTLGVDPARYHEESFDFATLAAAEPETIIAPATGSSFAVNFTKSARSIDVAADQFILSAARAAGMRLPSSCTKGMCGTCKSKLVSGQVGMQHQGGIRQREIDQGMILICCSRPLSDLVIER
ncbi:2Fe-2S iron-sulfur cluster-binding protein [Acidiphilium acidophilum]|uniref:2Fe-2S iron-sulfur cluster-binding protein n=1 Tax=Acidiphilium acidophilum TaxID=76588 RepID=UPI002E8E73A8|nr:2Fe-2S iron-sulfur cluster-binding protein [Acidiphilium acidophilum]